MSGVQTIYVHIKVHNGKKELQGRVDTIDKANVTY
jgi:hypothetical protein